MEALMLLVMGITNLACFIVGAKVGQMVSKGETIEAPTINPAEILREQRERREERKQAEAEQEKIDTILQNIERYDGTSIGQKDVPRG